MGDSDQPRADLRWETLTTETVYHSPDFSVRRDTVELPGGREIAHESVGEPDTVVILPFTDDGAVVLVEEWRQAVRRLSRGLPAGTIEPEEDVITAAARELEEETGYETGDLERLASFEPANGLLAATHRYVIAYQCRPSGTLDRETDESIRTVVMEYEQIIDAVHDGRFPDGRSALGLLYADAIHDLPPDSGSVY